MKSKKMKTLIVLISYLFLFSVNASAADCEDETIGAILDIYISEIHQKWGPLSDRSHIDGLIDVFSDLLNSKLHDQLDDSCRFQYIVDREPPTGNIFTVTIDKDYVPESTLIEYFSENGRYCIGLNSYLSASSQVDPRFPNKIILKSDDQLRITYPYYAMKCYLEGAEDGTYVYY